MPKPQMMTDELMTNERLDEIINAVRKEERKKCARLCYGISEKYIDLYEIGRKRFERDKGAADAAEECAESIMEEGENNG